MICIVRNYNINRKKCAFDSTNLHSAMGSSVILQKYKDVKEYFTFQQKPIWRNVIGLAIIEVMTIYGLWNTFIVGDKRTAACVLFIGYTSAMGISIGAHRLWTHKTFKAKLPLRIFLVFCYILSGQYSLVQWVRDHRLHHKATDTDADPHNAKRGFFFSHCGWLAMKRHPEVKRVGKQIDVRDVMADPVVQFQQKYFVVLFILVFMIFPTPIPLLWNESWKNCILSMFFCRYGLQLNLIWTVNSLAHFYGTRPYNKNIMAVQNVLVSFWALGEGWHNYHHVFPWDYKVSALGTKFQFGTMIIKFFESIGQAYDLREAPAEMVNKAMAKARTFDPIYEVAWSEEEHTEMKEEGTDIKEKVI